MSNPQDIDLSQCREILAENEALYLENLDDSRVSLLADGELNRAWREPVGDLVPMLMDYLDNYTSAKNKDESRTVTDPITEGEIHNGVWRQAFVRRLKLRDGNYYIVQTLRKGYITKLVSGATVDYSEVRLDNSRHFPGDGVSAQEDYAILRWPNVSPDDRQSIVDSLNALNADTFQPRIRGEALGSDWHRILATSAIENDGSATVTMLLARPEYSLETYERSGTAQHEDVSNQWNVPKTLAQGIIDAWEAPGRSARASYGQDGLVNIILSEKVDQPDIHEDIITFRNCDRYRETDYYWGVSDPDLYSVPDTTDAGVTIEKLVNERGDNTYTIVIHKTTRNYRNYDDVLVTNTPLIEVEETQQLGVTSESPEDISVDEDGKIKRQRIAYRDDCSKDITTTIESAQNRVEAQRVSRNALTFVETVDDELNRSSPAAAASASQGVIETVDVEITPHALRNVRKRTITSREHVIPSHTSRDSANASRSTNAALNERDNPTNASASQGQVIEHSTTKNEDGTFNIRIDATVSKEHGIDEHRSENSAARKEETEVELNDRDAPVTADTNRINGKAGGNDSNPEDANIVIVDSAKNLDGTYNKTTRTITPKTQNIINYQAVKTKTYTGTRSIYRNATTAPTLGDNYGELRYVRNAVDNYDGEKTVLTYTDDDAGDGIWELAPGEYCVYSVITRTLQQEGGSLRQWKVVEIQVRINYHGTPREAHVTGPGAIAEGLAGSRVDRLARGVFRSYRIQRKIEEKSWRNDPVRVIDEIADLDPEPDFS